MNVHLWESGRHSGVVLPSAYGEWFSYEYGEWAWVVDRRTAWWRLFPALLWSTDSYLMRGIIPVRADGIDIADLTRADRLWTFPVDRRRAERLQAALDRRFLQAAHTAVIVDGRRAVRDVAPYHLRRNCNRVTGAWLRLLGCEVSGDALAWDWAVQGVEPLIPPWMSVD